MSTKRIAAIGGFVLFFFLLGSALAFGILWGLIYLLFNVLLPIVGIAYPLTAGQCAAGAGVVIVVKMLLSGLFNVLVNKGVEPCQSK